MSVLQVADLQAHLGGVADDGSFQIYLDQAEAAVAAEIGADALDQVAGVVEHVRVEQTTRLLALADGPAGLLTSAINANDATDIYTSVVSLPTPWLLELYDAADTTRCFGAGLVLDITFDQGWTKAQLPKALRLAILNTAQWIEERPDGDISSERIGDYSYTLRQAPGSLMQTLPASAMAGLQHLRDPELAL